MKRPDGKLIRDIEPYEKIMPLIMKKRYDAMVTYKLEVDLEKIDSFLKKKRKEGKNYSYMHIIYAAIVRTFKEKPKINRFVMNGRLYMKNNIEISMAIKPRKADDAEESTVKIPFTGNENLEEIKEKLNSIIFDVRSKPKQENDIGTDSVASFLNKLPMPILKFCVSMLLWLDRKSMAPKSIIKASPFHASAFVTNVGSIGLSNVYHHIYDVGTVGLFLSIGKKAKTLKKIDGQIVERKYIPLGIVIDERICDGYYFSSATKYMVKLINNPEVLEKHYDEITTKDLDKKEAVRRKKRLFNRPKILESKALKRFIKDNIDQKEENEKLKNKPRKLTKRINSMIDGIFAIFRVNTNKEDDEIKKDIKENIEKQKYTDEELYDIYMILKNGRNREKEDFDEDDD